MNFHRAVSDIIGDTYMFDVLLSFNKKNKHNNPAVRLRSANTCIFWISIMILRVHTDRQSHPFSQNFIQWAEHYFFHRSGASPWGYEF